MSLKAISIPTTRGFATRGELRLPFVTRGEFIIPTTCGFATRGRNYTIPTPPPEGIEDFALNESYLIFLFLDLKFFFYAIIYSIIDHDTFREALN